MLERSRNTVHSGGVRPLVTLNTSRAQAGHHQGVLSVGFKNPGPQRLTGYIQDRRKIPRDARRPRCISGRFGDSAHQFRIKGGRLRQGLRKQQPFQHVIGTMNRINTVKDRDGRSGALDGVHFAEDFPPMLQIVGMAPAIENRAHLTNPQGFVEFGAIQAVRFLQLVNSTNRDGIQVELGHLTHFLLQTHGSHQGADSLIVGRCQRITGHRPGLYIPLSPSNHWKDANQERI